MNPSLVEEIRRHLASVVPSTGIDSFAYANAIKPAFSESTREIQAIILQVPFGGVADEFARNNLAINDITRPTRRRIIWESL